jgi:hypothetical protein
MHINKAEFIAAHGKMVALALGNTVTADYELVDLDACPIDAALQADFTRRGFCCVATYGMIDEQFCQAYDVPLPADVVVGLAQSYACLVLHKMANPPKQKGDSTDWLARLWELPDTRESN